MITTPQYPLLTATAALALALSACANRTAANATAEAPGDEGSVATYASTNDDAPRAFVYGTLTVRETETADETADEASVESTDPSPQPGHTEVEYAVHETVLEDCDIDRNLYFAHDSAEIDTVTEMKIDQIAYCLQQPPREGDPIDIIGHADEQGSEEYNRELGLERADAVAKALASEGVDRSRIETYSRGEFLADEPGLWDDRRVVIRMAK